MKVAFISRFPNDIDKPRGGVESATVNLAKALLDANVDRLTIVTAEPNVRETIIQHYGRLEVHRLARSSLPMILDVFGGPTTIRLRNHVRQLAPDILHFHETWGFGSTYYKMPSIFTVHGFDSLNLPTEQAAGWRIRSGLWKFAEATALRRQRQIISIAPYVTRVLQETTTSNIYEIWNALDVNYFDYPRTECPGRVLFLGWLNARKNPLAVVESAGRLVAKHPDIEVKLCGEASDPGYLKMLNEKIVELGLQNNVALPGRLDQSQVMKELSEAAVMVLPSFQENAPMVVAEAMAMGVPIVASNLCGIPDMIQHMKSGILVDPLNIDDISATIDLVLSNRELRNSLSSTARRRAREMFHPDEVAKKTLLAYEKVHKSVLSK